MTPGKRFACYICVEPSSDICRFCTKDTCENHICERCNCCSDCCRCEMRRVKGSGDDPHHSGVMGARS